MSDQVQTHAETACSWCNAATAPDDQFCSECGAIVGARDPVEPVPDTRDEHPSESRATRGESVLPAARPARPSWLLPVAIVFAGVAVLISGVLIFLASRNEVAERPPAQPPVSLPRDVRAPDESEKEFDEAPVASAAPVLEPPIVTDQIQTSLGVLTIESAEVRDDYVECPVGQTNCKNVTDGPPIAVLSLRGPPGTSSSSMIEDLSAELFESTITGAGEPAYVSNVSAAGAGRIEVFYKYVATGQELVLNWPANPRILLNA